MADSYLDIAEIADDLFMQRRVAACVTQQQQLDPAVLSGVEAKTWTVYNSLRWASTPSWGEKWASAKSGGITSPGENTAVITDLDILSAIQPMVSPPAEV